MKSCQKKKFGLELQFVYMVNHSSIFNYHFTFKKRTAFFRFLNETWPNTHLFASIVGPWEG